MTTHHLEEAEALADRIAVVSDGRVVATGTPEGLGGRDRRPALVAFTIEEELEAGLGELLGRRLERRGRQVRFEAYRPLDDLELVRLWAERQSLALPDLTVSRPGLEEVYLELVEEAR
jgi:ABC-2 type transport system ATP-binding protein